MVVVVVGDVFDVFQGPGVSEHDETCHHAKRVTLRNIPFSHRLLPSLLVSLTRCMCPPSSQSPRQMPGKTLLHHGHFVSAVM